MADLFLEKGANVNSRDILRRATRLFKAAKNGQAAMVKLLLDKGADHPIIDEYYLTPLSMAVEMGHRAIIKLLHDARRFTTPPRC